MIDWYDANYYGNSPENNPKGPSTGKEKVLRSIDANEGSARNIKFIGPVTIGRWHREPNPPLIDDDSKLNQNRTTSARCVANLSKPMS